MQGGPSKRNTQNSGVHASGVSSDVDPNIKESNCSSRSKDGKSTTRVLKKRDGGAPKDSNDIDASERANVSGEKEVKKPVESEDDVAKQFITSDTDKDQNTQKPEHGSKSEHQKGATKACKNRGEKGNNVGEKAVDGEDNVVKQGVMPDCPCENFPNGDGGTSGEQITGNGFGETERVSDGASAEQLKNRDDNKSVDETAETGNSIGEKELDVGKQVMSSGTSGEQIPNLHDDDQSVDETSQMGNGVGETERVSDGASAEQLKNRDDNKGVDETAETGNSIGEKELDAIKQVIMSGGTSGEQVPNLHDDDQSVDEMSKMGNSVGETEGVSDGALVAEPIKNPDDNKSVDEMAETGNNSVAEKESDSVKQIIMCGGTSGEQIPNPHNDNQSIDENSQTGNGVGETERVSDGALAEPIKNPDDNKSVDETAEKGNDSGTEKELDAVKQVIMYDGASGQHITNSDDDKSPDEMAEMANGVCEKTVEVEGDLVKQSIMYDGESGEQTKNRDDDNVMIGENIDESTANPDAMQKPNINLDLAVKREIVGISIDLDGGHSRHDKVPPNLWKLK